MVAPGFDAPLTQKMEFYDGKPLSSTTSTSSHILTDPAFGGLPYFSALVWNGLGPAVWNGLPRPHLGFKGFKTRLSRW